MIRYSTSSIFDVGINVLVNPVNCFGVMGKGLALEFKNRYERNFRLYKEHCSNKNMKIGKMFPCEDKDTLVINFPTKLHWKDPSRLEYIEEGLKDLVDVINLYSINGIAIPKIGCGLGGLEWRDVDRLINSYLGKLDNIDVVLCVGIEDI